LRLMALQPTSYRDSIRWGLLLAAIAVTGYRLPRAVRDFREWRSGIGGLSPSLVDAYRTIFLVDVVGIAVVLVIGIGLFYFLRTPKHKV
jgi:hypothetical protein